MIFRKTRYVFRFVKLCWLFVDSCAQRWNIANCERTGFLLYDGANKTGAPRHPCVPDFHVCRLTTKQLREEKLQIMSYTYRVPTIVRRSHINAQAQQSNLVGLRWGGIKVGFGWAGLGWAGLGGVDNSCKCPPARFVARVSSVLLLLYS